MAEEPAAAGEAVAGFMHRHAARPLTVLALHGTG